MYPIYKIKLHNPTMHKPQSDTCTWQREEIEKRANKFVPPIRITQSCPIYINFPSLFIQICANLNVRDIRNKIERE